MLGARLRQALELTVVGDAGPRAVWACVFIVIDREPQEGERQEQSTGDDNFTSTHCGAYVRRSKK